MRVNMLSTMLVIFCLMWRNGLAREEKSFETLQAGPPNIVFIMVDDLGWQDTSVPFVETTNGTASATHFHTPRLEQLAREGMKFTSFYATSVCTPTRISLMTGMNAAHHGVTNWTALNRDVNSDSPNDATFLESHWNLNGLSPVQGVPRTVHATPLPVLLNAAGYYTIHVGKAHWGPTGTPGANPHNLGFNVNIAGHAAGMPTSYLSEQNYGNIAGRWNHNAVPDMEEYYGSGKYLTEALTIEALKALEDPIRRGQPFFLYLSHYAVHIPIQADERYFTKYVAQGIDSTEAMYASMVEGVDHSVGGVMDFLKLKGVDKNTVVIFTSDNGGFSLVPPRAGRAFTHNAPLRAGKGSLYEGGIRVPLLIKWPGVIAPGSSTTQYFIMEDFYPSLLEVAGVTGYETTQKIDGISFLSVLRNTRRPDDGRALIWHYPNKWIPNDGPAVNYSSAIRQGRWKLVYNMRTETAELYDLIDDLSEKNNVARQNPNKVRELTSLLSASLRKWKSPMPIKKNTGRAAPWPDDAIFGQ